MFRFQVSGGIEHRVRNQESESRIQEDYQINCHTRESGYPVESGFTPKSIPHPMRDLNDDLNGLSSVI